MSSIDQQQEVIPPEKQRRDRARRNVVERFPDDAVVSIKEFAALLGIHHLTLRRMISAGKGPPTVRINERHFGIILRQGRAWIEGRTVKPKISTVEFPLPKLVRHLTPMEGQAREWPAL